MGKRRNSRELERARQEKRAGSAERSTARSTQKAKKPFWVISWLKGRMADMHKRYESDRKGFLLRTAYLLVMIVYALIAFLRNAIALRQTAVFDIFERMCLSSIPLYFAYFSKNRPRYIVAKILMTLIAACFWWNLFGIGGKVLMLINLVLCWATVLYTVGLKIIKDEDFIPLSWTATVYAFIIVLGALSNYTYLTSPGSLQFWVVPLIFGVLCGVICTILLLTDTLVLKDNRVSERVAIVLVVVAVGFIFSMSSAYHLNYALDPDPPREEIVIITKMDIRSSGKSTSYELYFWYGGEERKIDVGLDTYDLTEVGDRFEIIVCDGAFDKPFLREK